MMFVKIYHCSKVWSRQDFFSYAHQVKHSIKTVILRNRIKVFFFFLTEVILVRAKMTFQQPLFKGIVQVVPNLYECLCFAEHKRRYSEESL